MPGLKGQGLDHFAFHRTILAGTTGLEPAVSALTVPRGLQLLHAPEPSAEVDSPDRESGILPLDNEGKLGCGDRNRTGLCGL